MAMTRAQKIRAERQEQLRDYLSSRGLVEYVIEIAEKIEQPEADVQALKASADIRMKLINKYLPDMKFVESENTHQVPEGIEVTYNIVDPKAE